MNLFRLLVIFLILLFRPQGVLAQLRVKSVAGLAQNTVYALSQDEAGFLWIGTGNGLQRFDGREMKSYRVKPDEQEDGLSGRFVRNGFLHDSAGNIWFSTENGTQYIEHRSGKVKTCFIRLNERRLPLQGTYPLATAQHQYWLVNESSGLFLYDPEKEMAARYPVPQYLGQAVPLQIRGVVDKRGDFWFATAKGLFHFSRNSRQWNLVYESIPFSVVACINDTIWAASGANLYSWAANSGTPGMTLKIKHAQVGNITTVHQAFNGTVWIGDDKGNLFSKEQGTASPVWRTNINPLFPQGPLMPIYCLYTTRDGMLWIGTDVLGLLQTHPDAPMFDVFPKEEQTRKSFFVQSIKPKNGPQFVLGLYQQGLFEYDKKRKTLNALSRTCSGKSKNKNVYVLHVDSSGQLWTFHCGILEVTQGKQRHQLVLQAPKGVLSETGTITAFTLKRYGDVWLLGTSIGLYRISFQHGVFEVKHLSAFGYTAIIDIWVHPKQKSIWLGMETGGIGIVNSLAQTTKPIKLPGQEKNSIKQFAYNPNYPDYLWVASLNGLLCIYLPGEKQFLYTEAHGMANSYLSGVAITEKSVWITSGNAGVAKANLRFPKSGDVFPRLEFENFTTNDGLPTNEFNSGACTYWDGTLLMGSSVGLVRVDSHADDFNVKSPNIKLIQLLVNGKVHSDSMMPEWTSHLTLEGRKQSLQLKFAGIGFNHPERFQYRYCLKGWDATWINNGEINEVRYANLPPGKYTFLASVRALGGEWSEPMTLTILINPPFWMRPWFYIPLGALLVSLLFVLVRYITQRRLLARVAVLEQKQQLAIERTRISQEMHDDIGAGLTQITLMSEALAHQVNHAKAHEIAEVSRKLVHNMSEIVWSLHAESSSLQEVFAYLREHLGDFLESQSLDYKLVFPETATNPILDFKLKRNLMLLVKEAVHNAVKHSGATMITVLAQVEKDQLIILVKDNGKGFDSEMRFSGHGLQNMQLRAQTLGGACTFTSNLGEGTDVVMEIPIKGVLPKSP